MSKDKVFSLRMSVEVYQELQEVADRHQSNVPKLLRAFIRLGLLVTKDEDNSKLFFKSGDEYQRVIVLIE